MKKIPFVYLTDEDGNPVLINGNNRLEIDIGEDSAGLAKDSTLVTMDAVLDAIKAQTDKLTFDGSNNLKVTL